MPHFTSLSHLFLVRLRLFLVSSEGLKGREGDDGLQDQGAEVVEQQQQGHAPREGLSDDMETSLGWGGLPTLVHKYVYIIPVTLQKHSSSVLGFWSHCSVYFQYREK